MNHDWKATFPDPWVITFPLLSLLGTLAGLFVYAIARRGIAFLRSRRGDTHDE